MCVRKCNCDYYGIKTMYVLSLWNGTLFSTFVKYMLTDKSKVFFLFLLLLLYRVYNQRVSGFLSFEQNC